MSKDHGLVHLYENPSDGSCSSIFPGAESYNTFLYDSRVSYTVKPMVLDADGLIKLGRSGLLPDITEAQSLVISDIVYQEAVVNGLIHAYPDAQALAELVDSGAIRVHKIELDQSMPVVDILRKRLHPGELSSLELYLQLEARLLVSDDRAFLRLLLGKGINFLRVADFIAVNFRQGVLTRSEVMEGLIKIRSIISTASYRQAIALLKGRGDEDDN